MFCLLHVCGAYSGKYVGRPFRWFILFLGSYHLVSDCCQSGPLSLTLLFDYQTPTLPPGLLCERIEITFLKVYIITRSTKVSRMLAIPSFLRADKGPLLYMPRIAAFWKEKHFCPCFCVSFTSWFELFKKRTLFVKTKPKVLCIRWSHMGSFQSRKCWELTGVWWGVVEERSQELEPKGLGFRSSSDTS